MPMEKFYEKMAHEAVSGISLAMLAMSIRREREAKK